MTQDDLDLIYHLIMNAPDDLEQRKVIATMIVRRIEQETILERGVWKWIELPRTAGLLQ